MPRISNASTLVTLFQIDRLMTCLQGDMHNATKMQRKCKEDARKHVNMSNFYKIINYKGVLCIVSSQSKVEHRHDQDTENKCFPARTCKALIFDTLLSMRSRHLKAM